MLMIIQLRPNDYNGTSDDNLDNCKFIHMPKIDMSFKEQNKWYNSVKKDYLKYLKNKENNIQQPLKIYENYNINKVLYYRIDQARCTLVKRNHNLFLSYIPTYKKIWDYVLFLREHKDKADKFIDFINKNEIRNKWGFIQKMDETNTKIMNYLDTLINEPENFTCIIQ